MVRVLTLFVLALLGVPVAMHVVMHDLSDHHAVADAAAIGDAGHGDHEHPIVGSPAPAPLRLMRISLPVVLSAEAQTLSPATRIRAPRDVLSFGALRIDDDVGLQPLLATFLI